jgi:hypothetical protein
MKTRTLILSAILILLVAMTAGCTKAKTCPLTVSQTEGLQIQRVEPSYFVVPVNDEISIYMDVQNRGNNIARNVQATLWAHTGFALSSDSITQYPPKYDPYKKNLEELTYGKVYPNGMITSPDLESPRLDICSEGDVQTFHWRIKAGCDPVETILAVYLDYDYESSGYAKIPLASREQYERTQGELKSRGENFPSAGPMQVKIESVQAEPVLISKETKVFSARVLFNNVGPGLLGPKGMGDAGTVDLTLSGPCKFSTRNTKANIGGQQKDLKGIEITDSKKNMLWKDGTVIMRSGDQEAMKLAYIEYDCDTDDTPVFAQYKCCVDDGLEPTWSASGRVWTLETDGNCPTGLHRNAPNHCDVYPSADSCSRLCQGGTLVRGAESDGYCNCPLDSPCDKEIDNFIEDICRIEITANYHYQTVESPSKTMGVYGSPSQIDYCLSSAGQAN